MATARPSTVAVMPRPTCERNSVASGTWSDFAASTTANDSGCSLPRSAAAAKRSTTSSRVEPSSRTVVTPGRPTVSVPVLSTTRVSTFASTSSASALRINTPDCAPRPIATTTEMGVASPSAQGQAMISTDTAETNACASRGSGPQTAHTTPASTAAATTPGTKNAATRSASCCSGARLRCASATRWTIFASSVSRPTRSARITKLPPPFAVPPTTFAPATFSTGIDSPVSIDSSTALAPSSTTPSTGTRSPARTLSLSPTSTASRDTSSSVPSLRRRFARAGARSSSARSAFEVRARARNSSTWPSATRVMITAADSK